MSIRIEFLNPERQYYPGTIISGNVHVQMTQPKDIKKIVIKFKGKAKTHWVEYKGKVIIGYAGKQIFFDNDVILAEESDKFKLLPGNYTYPFEYLLPDNLPANYKGKHGSIKYTAKAFIDIPWSFNIKCKETFKMTPVVDLNTIPLAGQRLFLEEQKSIGFLCCTSGNIKLTVSAPTSGFVCSELVPFYVQIQNDSGSEIYETEIAINKKITYLSTKPKGRKRIKLITLVSEKWETEIPPHSIQHTFNAPLQLISTEPSTTDDTLIVKNGYEVVVTLKIKGMHFNVVGKSNIIIGNVPLNSFDMEPPSMVISTNLTS